MVKFLNVIPRLEVVGIMLCEYAPFDCELTYYCLVSIN